MRRAGIIAAVAIASLVACASAQAHWHAAAGRLPRRYHLVETDRARSKADLDAVCYGGAPAKNTDEESSCDDNSLTVYTLRHGARYGLTDSPTGPEHRVTIRGRHARWHWLEDEGQTFARELILRVRPGLRVSVVAYRKLGLRNLLFVGSHLRALDSRAWKLLLRQTTYEAQLGRFEPGMKRVEAASGSVGGDPWRLDALIPPGYPLSRDDLRPACVELTYRGQTGRGEFCFGRWQRVAGQVFVFGDLPNSWRRFRVNFYRGYKEKPVGHTHAVQAWSRSRFFAMPLGTNTCDLFLDDPDDRGHDGPAITPPPGGADYHRCGFDQEPP